MNIRFLSRSLGLIVVVVALAFSFSLTGCAMNDGYTPISSGSVHSGYAPAGGYASQGGGFRSGG